MKIQNADRLRKKMAALPKEVRAELRKALKASAEEMVDVAQRAAPKRSGALQRSIGYTFGAFGPENANVRGVKGGGVGDPDLSVTIHAGDALAFYASFVEFGTAPHTVGGRFAGAHHPGSTPQPFFFPAYRLTKKRAAARLARATRAAARKVARS